MLGNLKELLYKRYYTKKRWVGKELHPSRIDKLGVNDMFVSQSDGSLSLFFLEIRCYP